MARQKTGQGADRVKMVNTDTRNGALGAAANVKADQVKTWEAKGWKMVKEGKDNA